MSRSSAVRLVAATSADAPATIAVRLAVDGRPLSAAGAAAFGLLVAAAFAVQARRPGDSAAGLQQLAVAALAAAGTAALADDRGLALLALVLAAAAAALLPLHPRGGVVVTLPDTPSRTLVALALAGAALLWPLGGAAAGPRDTDPVSVAFAAAAAAAPLVALVAALRPHGWRWSAWSAAAAAVILAPGGRTDPVPALGWYGGTGWAVACGAWAIAFAAFAEWRHRATRDV